MREPSALPFKGLAEVAEEAGTARFEMRQVMPELGREPLSEASGVVDFRAGNFAGGTQQVFDRVLYGRKEDGTWTSLELGNREVVGPIWLLLLLRGNTAVEPSGGAVEGASSFDLTVSLPDAQRVTDVALDVPLGLRRRDLGAVHVSVDIDEERRPSKVVVALPGLDLQCRYYDYGGAASPGSAPEATPLGGPSRLGFTWWAVRTALRRDRP